MNDDEIVREFLLESSEALNALDRDFVSLEQDPTNRDLLSAIFRAVHTIKGGSGFFGFKNLERVTHAGENLLSRLRDGKLVLDTAMTSALLAMVDAVRHMLSTIEASGTDGAEGRAELVDELTKLASGEPSPAKVAPAVAAPVDSAPPADLGAKAATVPDATTKIDVPPPADLGAKAATVPDATTKIDVPPPADLGAKAVTVPDATIRVDAAPPADLSAKTATIADTTIRVDVGLLDRVMNLVGELVLARNQILQFGATIKDASFVNASQRLNLLTTELQEGVMKTRMQPIGNVWNKFPRVVRDLAHSCGKKINLELDGTETELDRTIIEAIKDPLTHAVRNAIDHGVEAPGRRVAAGKPETGRLLLRAFHEGGQVNIEVSDDGAGLNMDRIRARAIERGLVSAERAARLSEREVAHMIFHPGFSTAEQVTNVSGRGVGMDVVKTNIEKIGGTVDISSRPHQGTTLKIKIPLTLAIIPALIVSSGAQRFAIPQVNLLELVRLEGEQAKRGIEHLYGAPVYRLRGNLLPLVFLNDALELKRNESGDDAVNIVVLQADDRQFGLVVDGINDTEEIVVKPLGKELKGLSVFAGATIMGDGRVALILDVLGIAQRANVVSASRERTLAESSSATKSEDAPRDTLLLFRVGAERRMAIPLALVARLEEIPLGSIERAAGRDVVQYRGAILPLLDLGRDIAGSATGSDGGPLQVVVYSEQGRSVGFVVSQILDVVEETITVRDRASRPGVLGAVVVQGKVTDLLDVHGVIRRSDPDFFAREDAA